LLRMHNAYKSMFAEIVGGVGPGGRCVKALRMLLSALLCTKCVDVICNFADAFLHRDKCVLKMQLPL
jgi:hypothetical protein